MYSAPDRVLVIDEDLNRRLSTELRRRGRVAHGIHELGLRGKLDPFVLADIFSRFADPVLVTGDDHMPDDHAAVLQEWNATVATIQPCDAHDPREDAYEREIVHKWAHVIAEQQTGTIRRYHLSGPVTWTTRKR
jgi:predicted nuclease of predicted toxin-antitoxin system